MVSNEPYPKDLMIRLPNVLIPPLGILDGVSFDITLLMTRHGLSKDYHVRDGHDQEKPTPGFHIIERLPDVVPAPFAGDNAHLVCAEALYSDDLFTVVETPGFHG